MVSSCSILFTDFGTLFVFAVGPLLPLSVIFFDFNGNFNGKMAEINKMAKNHFLRKDITRNSCYEERYRFSLHWVLQRKQKVFRNLWTKWNNLKPCKSWNSKFHQNKNHPINPQVMHRRWCLSSLWSHLFCFRCFSSPVPWKVEHL